MFPGDFSPEKIARERFLLRERDLREGTQSVPTFKLNARGGFANVLAWPDGRGPKQFTNRKQAENAAKKVDGYVINPGRVFYVRIDESIDEARKKRIELRFEYVLQGAKKNGKRGATRGGSVFAETTADARKQVEAMLKKGESIFSLRIKP